MCDQMRKISILLCCFSFTILYGQTSIVSIQTVGNYNQWKWDTTIVMQNGLIKMAIVPAIGARVMQYDLGSIPSLMVNSSLFGKKPTPSSGGYNNFGGYKTWPSPQSVWNWPPPPILDYGAYTILETSQTNDSVSLTVLSPIEKWFAAGIQFKRRATIFPGTSRLRMEQTIINKGTKDTSWGMWSIAQTIVNHTGKSDYANFRAYFPLNPNSVYGTSGILNDGASTAWLGEVAPGIYGVQFASSSKKVFADPDKGWIAYTSLSDTVVFARTFPVFEGMQYPDGGARTTVYVSAAGAPLYMEVEVKGPVVPLAANGGSYTFIENWWAAKVRAPILDVDSVGAIAGKLSYNSTTQNFSAVYGIFYQGTAKLAFVDSQGRLLAEGQPHTVTPLAEFQLQETVGIPNGSKTVKVQVYNMKNELMGVVESLDVSSLPTAINAATPIVVSEYRLAQNYPNPFNPNTVIGYQLPVNSYVTIKVYDMLGREAATLVDERKDAGIYEAKFDASMLTSGVYFYKLCAGNYSQTRKLLLIK
jgi:hypothetical protein